MHSTPTLWLFKFLFLRSTAVLFQEAITIICCSCSILENTLRRGDHEVPAITENNVSPSIEKHLPNRYSKAAGLSGGWREQQSHTHPLLLPFLFILSETRDGRGQTTVNSSLQQSSPSRSRFGLEALFFLAFCFTRVDSIFQNPLIII